jgi:hypothetical protein
MKKLMLASVLLLAGCRQPMSIEEVERAKLYCEERGAVTHIDKSASGSGFAFYAYCRKDGITYNIPDVIIKVNAREE